MGAECVGALAQDMGAEDVGTLAQDVGADVLLAQGVDAEGVGALEQGVDAIYTQKITYQINKSNIKKNIYLTQNQIKGKKSNVTTVC